MAVKLPRQLYTRGKQGTFVYSPDIAVFIKLSDEDGKEGEILDLSPYIVDFSMGRQVNDVSTFTCSIDNRYGQFDRVIKRMDRITVFLKRISWLQVFSGYVTTIPWQTVVPGNVTISAQCTIKRLAHNYFDRNSYEGMKFFSFWNADTDANLADGGAARTVVRLLTNIVNWPLENIQVQKIPPLWLEDAAKVIQALIKENDGGVKFQAELREIRTGLEAIIDAFGWRGYFDNETQATIDSWANSADGKTGEKYTEQKWHELTGIKDGRANVVIGGSGGVPGDYLFSVKANGLDVWGTEETGTNNHFKVLLRMDAAQSLGELLAEWVKTERNLQYSEEKTKVNVPIIAAYLDAEKQLSYMQANNGGCIGQKNSVQGSGTTPPQRFVGSLYEDYEYVKSFDTLPYEPQPGDDNYTDDWKQKYAAAMGRLIQSERKRSDLLAYPLQTGKYEPPDHVNDLGGFVAWPYVEINKNGKQYVAHWVGYPSYLFFDNETGDEWLASTTGSTAVDSDIIIGGSEPLSGAFAIKCINGKAGVSEYGWATCIKINNGSSTFEFTKWMYDRLNDYGWERLPAGTEDTAGHTWVFRGNDKYPIYWDYDGRLQAGLGNPALLEEATYSGAYKNVNGMLPGQMSDTGTKALFNVMWMGNVGLDEMSPVLIGERSWINDVPVLSVIKEICAASMRDFMSAPNGDFIAFVPDRLGRYDNFPTLQVRDIEVVDFKAIASDGNLVTHYLSTSDVPVPGEDLGMMFSIYATSAMMTVEQAPLMNFLLGRPIDEVAQEYGPKILSTFGLRPMVQENKFIRNRAFNFTYALHKFQEVWSNQWQFSINLTFMPEIYPGMRLELVDRTLPDGTPAPLAVYVESVSHTGSRTTGFNTNVLVSTPMIKVDGKWTMFRPEYGPVTMPSDYTEISEAQKTAYRDKAKRLFEKNPDWFV